MLSITSVSRPSEAPYTAAPRPGRAGADNEQVDLLARRELAADPERARDLAGGRAAQLGAARQPDQRQARLIEAGDQRRRRWIVRAVRVAPGERQAVAARELEHPHRRFGRVRPDDLETDALDPLERLAPRDEGRQHEVAERAVLVQQRAQRVAVDRDVTQRLGDDRRDEHRLPGQQVQLAEEARCAVADDLVAGRVEDRDLALEDRDERIAPIADAIQHLADLRRALLAELGERRQLRRGQRRARRRGDGT